MDYYTILLCYMLEIELIIFINVICIRKLITVI